MDLAFLRCGFFSILSSVSERYIAISHVFSEMQLVMAAAFLGFDNGAVHSIKGSSTWKN